MNISSRSGKPWKELAVVGNERFLLIGDFDCRCVNRSVSIAYQQLFIGESEEESGNESV